MEPKEELKLLVNLIKKITGWSQEKVATEAGYKPHGLTQAMSKKDGHEAVIKQLRMIYKNVLEKSTLEEGVANTVNDSGTGDYTNTEKGKDLQLPQSALDAIIKLINTNDILARSNADVSAGNLILAETNRRLADRVLDTRPPAPAEKTFEAFEAKMGNLLESLVEIVTDKEPKSKQQVSVLLHTAFHGAP